MQAQGYEPSALVNFVGLMGWSGPQSTHSSHDESPSPSSPSSSPSSNPSSDHHKALDYANVDECLTIDQMIEKVSFGSSRRPIC